MVSPESSHSFLFRRGDFAFASTIHALKDHFHYCREEKFTGQLELKIQAVQARPSYLYFEEGDLVWGDGGVHPIRRWNRQLSQQCSAEVTALIHEAIDQIQPGNYEFLRTLLLQQKIQPQDVKALIEGLLTEILFDLHQLWLQRRYRSTLELRFNYTQLDKHAMPVAIPFDSVWLQAMQEWQEWQEAGLENYVPNQAPLIVDTELLRQQVLPSTYQNLVTIMDGNRTLRDLAVKSNRDLLIVTQSLLPYVQQGSVQFVEVEDLKSFAYVAVPPTPQARSTPTTSTSKLEAPLIAYIDDYKVDGQIMNRILTQMGYRCIHIQDPLQALPLLLEHKPELIFLDLVMPIINGYEACAQIRRVSRFKDIPVIILTSNDGIVDRVRARIVGSNGFLAKPIEPFKVQTVLQRYLGRG